MSGTKTEARSLLKYQLKPALVLGSSGKVIATNPGGLRLVCTSPTSKHHSPDAVIGKKISDLGIAIAPEKSPALRTWKDILAAAANPRTEPGDGGEKTKVSSPDRDISQATDDFWDLEAEKQCLVESSVYFVKTTLNGSSIEDAGRSLTIKARANVCWYSPGIFLVVFDRTSMPQLSGRSRSPDAKYPQRSVGDWPMPERSSASNSPATSPEDEGDLREQLPSAADVTSPIIPYIMTTLDPEGQAIQFSDSWYQFSGLGKAESLGSGWSSIIHPEDLVKMMDTWADVIQNGLPAWKYEARYRKASTREYRWFAIVAQPHKDASGQIVCWYSSMIDINDEVMARQEAARRRRSMLTLISQTPVMLWGVDRSNQLYICEGGLKWTPPEFPRSLQLSKQQETAQPDQGPNGCDQHKHEELVSVVQTVLLGGEFNPVVEHTEGERYFRTIFVVERVPRSTKTDEDHPVEAALALTFETTDEFARSKLRGENEQLAANERAASEASALKSRFLANMSHEIRTPISGIIGLSELLRDSEINREQSNLTHDIHVSAQFLLALVNDILDLSKIDSGHMAIESIPFNPCKMIRDTLVPLQFQAKERGLDLVWEYDVDTEATFLGDPHRMRQVLTNLIGNSLKFTKKGSVRLTVSTVPHPDSEDFKVQFVVQDTGIGIAEEAIALLFKPFSQADTSTARMYGGTGLGLSICQDLVRLMGGHMTLQSTLGKGTTVTFDVPFKPYDVPEGELQQSHHLLDRTRSREMAEFLAAARPAAQEPTRRRSLKPAVAQSSSSKLHVLVVDDNAINRKIISRFIKKFGFEVATACNGQEALDYLCKTSGKPRPEIVFMDCMMPVVNGYEATRKIRSDSSLFDAQTRALPIVALTAGGFESEERCREAGMDDFICRPVTQDQMKDAVLKWTTPKDDREVDVD